MILAVVNFYQRSHSLIKAFLDRERGKSIESIDGS
jgi:hypothetical protein